MKKVPVESLASLDPCSEYECALHCYGRLVLIYLWSLEGKTSQPLILAMYLVY